MDGSGVPRICRDLRWVSYSFRCCMLKGIHTNYALYMLAYRVRVPSVVSYLLSVTIYQVHREERDFWKYHDTLAKHRTLSGLGLGPRSEPNTASFDDGEQLD